MYIYYHSLRSDDDDVAQVTRMILKSITLPLHAVQAVGAKAEKDALKAKGLKKHMVRAT
jgi:hypothetical protein